MHKHTFIIEYFTTKILKLENYIKKNHPNKTDRRSLIGGDLG